MLLCEPNTSTNTFGPLNKKFEYIGKLGVILRFLQPSQNSFNTRIMENSSDVEARQHLKGRGCF